MGRVPLPLFSSRAANWPPASTFVSTGGRAVRFSLWFLFATAALWPAWEAIAAFRRGFSSIALVCVAIPTLLIVVGSTAPNVFAQWAIPFYVSAEHDELWIVYWDDRQSSGGSDGNHSAEIWSFPGSYPDELLPPESWMTLLAWDSIPRMLNGYRISAKIWFLVLVVAAFVILTTRVGARLLGDAIEAPA